jgi:iron complex outermembrane receptor protein
MQSNNPLTRSKGEFMVISYKHVITCTAGMLLAAAATAQEGSEPGRPVLEEVVVRAQKTTQAQSVQKVPLAVTAVSADTIAATQAVDIIDVSRIAPNTTFTAASTLPGFANFVIRGIGASGSTSTVDPAVNIVVDGMVYDFQGGTILDAFDLESVEILRGPQGILFGRNTTGGAVSLRSRRPGSKFGVEAEATLGDFNRRDFSGLVEGPLVPDRLFGKIAVLRRERDGGFDDKNRGTFVPAEFNPSGAQPPTLRETMPDLDTWVIRPSLLWQAGESIDLTLLGEIVRLKGGGTGSQPVPGFDQLLRSRYGYTPPTDDWQNNVDFSGATKIDADRLVAELNWDVGPGVITSVSGYRKVDYGYGFDADGTPFTLLEFPNDNHIDSKQYSEELRFASDFSDTVNFVAGLYYDHHELETTELRRQSALVGNPTGASNAIALLRGHYTQTAKSSAAFFNVNWEFVDRWIATAGGRYSWEKKDIEIIPLGACAGPNFTACPTAITAADRDWSDFSPKVGLQYQWTDDVLLYGSWTKGFRSGNFNGRATSAAQVGPAEPESASSSELGLKSTFWDDRARVNVALFHTKYEDIQRQVLLGTLQIVTNAAQATIKGIEVEATFRPFDSLELTANAGWTDAKFDRFTGLNLDGQPGISPTDEALAKRLKFDKVPEYTAYAAATYFFNLPAWDTELAARAAYSWRDKFFTDVVNSAFSLQDASEQVDASLAATRGHWRVTLFGNNLTDQHAIELANRLFVPIQYGGEPRTYGVTVHYRY